MHDREPLHYFSNTNENRKQIRKGNYVTKDIMQQAKQEIMKLFLWPLKQLTFVVCHCENKEMQA